MGISPAKLGALAQAQEFLRKQFEVSPEALARMTDDQKQWMTFRQRVAEGKLTAAEREKICAWHESGHAVCETMFGVGRLVQVSIIPTEISHGHVWTKIPQEKLVPLTENTIKRMFLCSLSGPFAEMFIAGQGNASGDWKNLYAFCKQHGLSDAEIRRWELWTCRQERDDDPVPGVNHFVLDNFEKIFHVAYVLHERRTLAGEEIRSLLWTH